MKESEAEAFQTYLSTHGIEGITRFTSEYPEYTHIGAGNTRHVFSHTTTAFEGDVVVKFAKDDHTTYANQYEAATWNNAPSNLEPHLAPVYEAAADGKWLVQQKVMDIAPPNWQRVEQAFEEAGLDTIDITEDNIGTLNGEPAVYDYPFDLG